MNDRLNQVYWTLKLTFGLVPIVAGLDKFANLLTDWTAYLSPQLANMLPFAPATFLHIVGIIEIAAGILVLSRWTRLGAYVVTAWLVLIALNLVSSGHNLDVAVRDLVMAVTAFRLGRVSEAREAAGHSAAALQHAVRA